MADRLPLSALSDAELEQRLIDLGTRLHPTTPDLVTQVRHRLESEPAQGTFAPLPATRFAGTRPVGDRRGGTEWLPSPRSEGSRAGDEGASWGEGRWLRGVPRQIWLIAALLLIVIAGGLVLFPEARNAIADRLGLGGVLIHWVDEVPTPEPS
jgi:hypothetical protein